MQKSSVWFLGTVFFCGMILAHCVCGAQESALSAGSPEAAAVPADEEVPAAPDAAASAEAPAPEETFPFVTAIEIRGNTAISSNTVVSKMKTRIGSPYQETIISDDLKRLYLLGFFSDIKVDTEPYKEGLKVIVTVQERPIIEKIVFSGIRRLTMKEDKIKAQLKSRETQYLDYPNLAEDVRTIKKLYEKIGYGAAQVTDAVDLNKQTNKAIVRFEISEGQRMKVREIVTRGNTAFSRKRLIKLMKTRNAWLFNAGVLKEETLSEDIERVRSFYRREGYADAEVDYDVEQIGEKPQLRLILMIQEGKKYLVGTVTVEGYQDIAEKEVLSQLKVCTTGGIFSQEGMQQDIANIQSLYFERGYISVQIQEASSLNAQTGRIDIKYRITENEVSFVDRIKIRGNVKTKDVVIRRELRIFPGDKFDGKKLRRSKERLTNLGFFEEVSYDTEDTDTPDRKDLIVDVKESKTGSFSFGGGYSTVDQLVGFVEVEQKNFDWKNFPYFTGDGQELKARASFGSISQGYLLSFTEPWIFDYPVSFGFDGYKRENKREEDIGYGYDQDISGGDVRLSKEVGEYIRASLTYRNDTIRIANIVDDATADLKQEEGKNNISSLQMGLSFDSRDNIFDTHSGNYLLGTFEGAGGPFGGDKDFWKFSGRASHYFPLWRSSSLEVRGRVGVVKPYGDSARVPIYERFFAGGAYTIRGYDERSVGPIDGVTKDPLGGESLAVGNIEYTYPIFDFLKAAVFYDVGNVWAKVGDLGSGGYKSGMGLGVRIKTPIGPIMLDYGIPLQKEPGEESTKSGKLHFSMSQGF